MSPAVARLGISDLENQPPGYPAEWHIFFILNPMKTFLTLQSDCTSGSGCWPKKGSGQKWLSIAKMSSQAGITKQFRSVQWSKTSSALTVNKQVNKKKFHVYSLEYWSHPLSSKSTPSVVHNQTAKVKLQNILHLHSNPVRIHQDQTLRKTLFCFF